MKPLADRIIVELLPQQSNVGGIEIPEMYREEHDRGIVVAVGPGKVNRKGHREPVDLSPGDKVLFERHAGIWHDIDGKKHRILVPKNIIAVINGMN